MFWNYNSCERFTIIVGKKIVNSVMQQLYRVHSFLWIVFKLFYHRRTQDDTIKDISQINVLLEEKNDNLHSELIKLNDELLKKQEEIHKLIKKNQTISDENSVLKQKIRSLQKLQEENTSIITSQKEKLRFVIVNSMLYYYFLTCLYP